MILQKWFTEMTLPSTPEHWHCCQMTRCQTLASYFTIKKAPPDIWSWENTGDLKIQLTRKKSSWHPHRLLPPKMSDQKHFSPFILPFLSILFLILISGGPYDSLLHLFICSGFKTWCHCSRISGRGKKGQPSLQMTVGFAMTHMIL